MNTPHMGSAVLEPNQPPPPAPPAPLFRDYNRTLYRRLVFEGELAGETLRAAPQHVISMRDEARLLAESIHRRAGWDVPLADIAQWDDATLKELGLTRDKVKHALAAAEHAQEVRAQTEAAKPILDAKRVLALHLEKWVADHFGGRA